MSKRTWTLHKFFQEIFTFLKRKGRHLISQQDVFATANRLVASFSTSCNNAVILLLFLIYINDLPNCSKKLEFKIFADDTNVFASASDFIKSLEILMNSELEKIKEWCDVNKLSINMYKTNFMIIKSPKKKDMSVDIHIKTKDGSCHSLDRKDHNKYLGVMIDASLSWKYQVSYICSRISRNIGILSKLRARLLNQQP